VLLDRNRLSLDEKIQTYVRDFPEKPWPVTLRQVMGHVAGIRNDGGDEGPLYGIRCDRTIEGLRPFADRDLLFEPGTQFHFSSYGWILMSAAVEAAAQEPFAAFMRAQIFEPLEMRDTKADSSTEPIANRATSYFPRFAADPNYGPDISRPIDLSCYAGAGAFLSTPSDLVRFGLAVNNGTLLQPATAQLLQSSQRLTSGEETGYGLGWDTETVDLGGTPTRWVGHDGTVLGGRVASLITFPDRGLVVAVMSNTSYADTESIALRIARVFAPAAILSASPGR
jgi:CubicO group peptidase (beta-lactamase class C family)